MGTEERRIPHDDRKLYWKMLRNNVGVAKSVTRAEINYNINVEGLDGSLEIVLQSMVANGLLKEREEILPTEKDIPASEKRRVVTYQVLQEGIK